MKKTIRELSKTYAIPIKKLARLQSDGFLVAANVEPIGINDQIAEYLAKGNSLTVRHFRHLIRNPGAIEELGDYQFAVERELAALGNVIGEAMAETAFPHNTIYDAAKRDPEAVARLAHYVRSVVPDSGCGYGYVALRCVLNVSDAHFPAVYPKLSWAIRNARASYILSPFCEPTDNGRKMNFRKPLDL